MNKKLQGFTLIELLIVIVIIGILAGLILSILQPAKAQRKANESVLRANTQKICLGLLSCANSTLFVADCNTMPLVTGLVSNIVDGVPAGSTYTVSGDDKVTVLGTLGQGAGWSGSDCVFSCSYTFSSGEIENITKGAGCIVD